MDLLIRKVLTTLENNLEKKDVRYYIYGKPFALSDSIAEKGAILVQPLSTNIEPISTGLRDEETFNLSIILVKQLKNRFNRNAQIESGAEFLTEVMEGRQNDSALKSTSIRDVVRKSFNEWGIRQESVSITYDSEEYPRALGVVTATMAVSVICIINQLLD